MTGGVEEKHLEQNGYYGRTKPAELWHTGSIVKLLKKGSFVP
jgi:hypothetical protein